MTESLVDCAPECGISELAADDMGPRIEFWNAYYPGEGNDNAGLCARASDYR